MVAKFKSSILLFILSLSTKMNTAAPKIITININPITGKTDQSLLPAGVTK